MDLKLFCPALAQNGCIALRFCIIKDHRLVKKVKAVDLLDCAGRGFDVVKDNERLAFGLQVGLRDNFHDIAILGEDLFQGYFELVDLDAFF
jgi:hypothetical protein